MEDFQKLQLERQKRFAPIHEAGHVIAARYVGLKIVFANIHTHGNECGLTRVVPMSAAYSRSTGLPTNKVEALTGFNRHNFKLLAGAAAQAIYCYDHDEKTLIGNMTIQPEDWGNILEFSKDDSFCDFDESKLTHGMAFFLTETGAGSDWITLLNQFKALPYHYFDVLNTHEKRIEYLHLYWARVLECLRERWIEVVKVAESLERERELTGDEIDSILS